MPVTPFHFGPGAALWALAPRQVSFLAFCASNVLIDLESLHNLVRQRYPVHTFLHTYLGATLVIVATVLLSLVLRAAASSLDVRTGRNWRALTLSKVAVGATLGAYSHVALDSLMHADIRPLAPMSASNVLLGAVRLDLLHWGCVVSGVIGLTVAVVRRINVPNDRS